MKYSVSIYSFAQYIKAGKLTPCECVVKAKEMGFDAIEIVDFVFGGTDAAALARELKQTADAQGIAISNLAVGGDVLEQGAAERLKAMVDIADILGAPFMRHDVCGAKALRHFETYDSVLSRLADVCREVTGYAKTKGIRTMTENHGYFSQDSVRVEKLIGAVANDNFGQLIDIGNFLCADEDPVTAVGRNARYAFYVHAKDFIVKSGDGADPGEGFFMTRGGNYLRGTVVGHGNVPVLNCLRALKRAGFDGWIAVEFEGMEDCINGIRIGFDNLKRYCEMI